MAELEREPKTEGEREGVEAVETIRKERSWRSYASEGLIYAVIFFGIVYGTPWVLAKTLKTDYPVASITSSSMWPVLKEGDVVFIKGVTGREDLATGDIIVFENEKGFTIHRVVEKREEILITKGDANNVNDSPIRYDQVVGKAVTVGGEVLRIPYLGMLSRLVQRNK